MTLLREMIVTPDPTLIDAFGRERVSNPTGLYAYQHEYDEGPLQWEYLLDGGGSILYVGDEAAVKIRTTTALDDAATKHSRSYFRYQPGKSQLIKLTGVLGAIEAGLVRQVGYFDDENGLLFEQDGDDGGLGIVVRTSTSGSVVNNRVPKASWNLDPMDGTGPSGITLDETQSQIFIMDLQWLGVGTVRFGFSIDGRLHYVHAAHHANIQNVVYTRTANLPIRYRIWNRTAQGAARELVCICTAVDSEGGFEIEHGNPFCADNGCVEQTIVECVQRAVLSIRPKLTFNGRVNRARMLPTAFDLLGRTQALNWAIAYNLDLPGAVWTSVGAHSVMEYSTHVVGGGAFTTNSRSIFTQCGYIPVGGTGNSRTAGSRGGAQDIFLHLPIGLDAAGANPTAVSIMAQGVDGNGLMAAGMNWLEFR